MKKINKYQQKSTHPDHLDENEIAQYIDYLRHETDQIPDKLIDHVQSCGYCRAEIMEMTDLLDVLPDVAGEPVPAEMANPDFARFRKPSPGIRILRTAAAVAALVLLAWGVKELLPDRSVNNPVAIHSAKDSTAVSDQTDRNNPEPLTAYTPEQTAPLPDTVLYAEAFTVNPVYEKLTGAKYRTGNDPEVTGPERGAVFTSGDSLKWSWLPDAGEGLELQIVDNKANTVRQIKTGTTPELSWKIDLKPGLYYWKFQGKDEIWKVGKIIIRQRAEGRGQKEVK